MTASNEVEGPIATKPKPPAVRGDYWRADEIDCNLVLTPAEREQFKRLCPLFEYSFKLSQLN